MTCNPIDSTLLTVLLLQPDDYGSINKASHWLFMPQLVKQLSAGRNLKINTWVVNSCPELAALTIKQPAPSSTGRESRD